MSGVDKGDWDFAEKIVAIFNGVPSVTINGFDATTDDLVKFVNRVLKERDGLKAIVDKLPTTEDGEPIHDGMMTYCDDHQPFPHCWRLRDASGMDYRTHCRKGDERHYSTFDKALDARKGRRL